MSVRTLGLVLLLTLIASTIRAAPFDPLTSAAIEPKLGGAIPRDLAFADETGRRAALGDYLGRPMILAPVAYNCKNICGVTLAGLFSALADTGLDASSFAVLAVSIDPRETVADARRSRAKSLTRWNRAGASREVHFLADHDGSSSHALAEAIGFQYAYDAGTDQFSHPAAVAVITPSGKLARWLYGYPFESSDLRLALAEAGKGTIGTLSDRLWLLCYGYDPKTGTYTADVDLALKAGGGLTMVLLGGFVVLMLRRERRRPGDGR